MSKTKTGGQAPGESDGRATLAGVATATATTGGIPDTPIIGPNPVFCQAVTTLEALAREATKRANAAELYAAIYEQMGDETGRLFWLKRRARHLMVLWAATHPRPEVCHD